MYLDTAGSLCVIVVTQTKLTPLVAAEGEEATRVGHHSRVLVPTSHQDNLQDFPLDVSL